MSITQPQLTIFNDSESLSKAVAENWRKSALQANQEGRIVSFLISGGNTPRSVYTRLADPKFRDSVPWPTIHLFWGDERCVPPDHLESNFRMVRETLIDLIPIPENNIHRIRGENDPELEAKRYGDEILSCLCSARNNIPRFDWVILGLGADGHTASLFPGKDFFSESSDVCSVSKHPQTGQKRITLTMPVINQAARVTFLVTGKTKANVVADIFEQTSQGKEYPAGRVYPREGILQWYLDTEAASLLKK